MSLAAVGEARRVLEQEQSRLAAARARLNQVDEERRALERYAPAYRALLAAGIVGPEQRVNWIDAVRAASQSLRGFAVDYRLAAQQPARLLAAPAGVVVHESLMELNLKLLHEGDLLAFLSALDNQHAGLALPRSCTIQRLASGPFSARFEPKLVAECSLVWITLSPVERQP
ncbi:hypothetical protein [Thiobacter aerophilum]|uniref:Uncharacterized protein n=1 Tax=Thiobacter aerophilum TaxID=3121275 RepID=A0ABV0EFR1_9BURK